jgi:cysteine desulfurase
MPELPIYLDHNATTPCDPRVVESMLPYFTQRFGNAASRNHAYGWQAEEAVDIAREQVARLIGAEPKEIIFTSGATESDNLAIKGVFAAYASKGNHIITALTEHRAVLDTVGHIEKMGGAVSYLTVHQDGLIDLDELESSIKPGTILITLMYANNETGVIQPVKEIGQIARKHGILFFSDATQAVGKIPVNVNDDGIDLMALSAHKIYGPKGIGALYVRRKHPRVALQAQMDGGGHERGMRSGTLNVPGIVGLGRASELCMQEMNMDAKRTAALRDKLEQALMAIEGTYLNGNKEKRLPHVSNISFDYADGEAIMLGLNKDMAVSSGSACTSASLEPSHVLKAMGLTDELAHSSVRFSLGRNTNDADIDYAIAQITNTIKRIREKAKLGEM